MRQRLVCAAILATAAFMLVTGSVLAHGWPIPPYLGPTGGAAPAYSGPAGGGNTGSTEEAYTGPAGGTNTGGTTSAQPAEEAKTTATNGAPTGSKMGGATLGANRARPKVSTSPYMAKVAIPWQAAFLPVIDRAGYGSTVGSVEDALRLPQADGGWARDARMSIVLQFDSSDAEQAKVIDALDTDNRFKVAANLFNCFRMDIRASKSAVRDARLAVYNVDGSLVTEIVGAKKIRNGIEVLSRAYDKAGYGDLTKRMNRMNEALVGRAWATQNIESLEHAIVCPDCGHERHDVIERIADLKLRQANYDKAVADLRRTTGD